MHHTRLQRQIYRSSRQTTLLEILLGLGHVGGPQIIQSFVKQLDSIINRAFLQALPAQLSETVLHSLPVSIAIIFFFLCDRPTTAISQSRADVS